jgi:hypothetical protein
MIKVGLKVTLFISFNTAFRAKYIAHSAFNTFFSIGFRTLGTPGTRAVLDGITGLGNDAAYVQIFPGSFTL